jgi:hypothetical protein
LRTLGKVLRVLQLKVMMTQFAKSFRNMWY